MQNIAVTGLLLGSALAKPLTDDYSFNDFLKEFKPSWKDSEMPMRRELFEAEIMKIRAHNAGPSSWKKGVNKFTVMTAEEKKTMMGFSKGAHHHHIPVHEIAPSFEKKDISELPSSVDWRNTPNVVSAVKDQGHCGSCWAFSATASLESHLALSTGLLYNLSPQQIAMCTPNPQQCGGTGGCMGATHELAFDYLASGQGATEEFQVGYQAYYGQEADCAYTNGSAVASIEGYVRLPENDYSSLMNAVAQVGPVSIVVDASEWHSYESGIFDGCNQENPDLNHGVVLVGYGEENGQKYWTIRNSWSPSYGEMGYIRVARTEDEGERCGLDVTPQDGTACAGDNTPVTVCGTCGVLYDSSYPVGAALA